MRPFLLSLTFWAAAISLLQSVQIDNRNRERSFLCPQNKDLSFEFRCKDC
jgi:hypothetical protein